MKYKFVFSLLVLFLLVACSGQVDEETAVPPTNAPATNSPTIEPPTPEAPPFEPTPTQELAAADPETITILYTNDEHGWMEGMNPGAGAAELLGLWQAEEGYSPDDVVDFNFIDYETALREIVPEVQAAGADLILAPAHACQRELEELAPAVPELQAIVDKWREATATELNEVIGYTEAGIERRSPEMQTLITHAWLAGYPAADVAITNWGGMRAAIEPGEITLADIVGMMPFDNVIIEVTLSGDQLLAVLDFARDDAIAGAHRQDFQWILDSSDEAIDPDAIYSLLVNDFMYAGGDDYTLLAAAEPEAYNTAIDWRQPVIRLDHCPKLHRSKSA